MSEFVYDGKGHWAGERPEPLKPEIEWHQVNQYMGMGGNGTSIYLVGYRCGTCRAFILDRDDQEGHETFHRELDRKIDVTRLF